MIVDSSALAAILFGEDDAPFFIEALSRPERKYLSAVSRLEIFLVVESRKGPAGTRALIELLAQADIEVLPFDASLAEVAFDAWRRWGRGNHPAGLNMGDCASYALARVTNQKLLYKGNDFSLTDISTVV